MNPRTVCALSTAWLIFLAQASIATLAENKAWKEGVVGAWSQAVNWEPAGVPAKGDTITISSGSVYVTEPVVITGELHWSGGVLGGGPVTLGPGSLLRLVGEGDKLMGKAVLINQGTMRWEGGRLLNFGADHDQHSYVTNEVGGVISILCDTNTASVVSWSGFRPGRLTIHNAGAIIKEGTPGMTTFDGTLVQNFGLIAVRTGGAVFNGGLVNRGEIRGNIGLTPMRWEEGGFRLRVTGSAGLTLAISYSTNLMDWSVLLTTNAPAGTFELLDPGARASGQRFYRGSMIGSPE